MSHRAHQRQLLHAALSGVLLSGSLIASQATRYPQAPFMLGVLKQDGALQPLFHYDSGEWTTPWQYDADAPPSSVLAVPADWWPGFSASGWLAHLPSRPTPLVIRRIASVHIPCGEGIGLQTNYAERPPFRPQPGHGPSDVGIAAVGTVTVRLVEVIDLNSDSGNQQWRAANTLSGNCCWGRAADQQT